MISLKKVKREQERATKRAASRGPGGRTTTHQVSVSHVSLPVGLSVRSVAWHAGRRGAGAVRLTQEVACRAKQAHVRPHADAMFILRRQE